MSNTIFTRIKTLEEFDSWKNKIAANLLLVQKIMYNSSNVDMNYSYESLDHLTEWLLEKYDSLDDIHDDEDKHLLDAVGCYIGETFRQRFGGTWTIELDDQDAAYLGYPGITGFVSAKYPDEVVYPFTWSTTTILRQSSFVIERFNAHINRLQS